MLTAQKPGVAKASGVISDANVILMSHRFHNTLLVVVSVVRTRVLVLQNYVCCVYHLSRNPSFAMAFFS
jgi:hypothetical protein